MKQIRKGVFETNSSSTHSITICTLEDYEKFKKGELLYDRWEEKLVPADAENISSGDCETYNEFGRYLETYAEGFTTPSGDEIVAFGCYGYDG